MNMIKYNCEWGVPANYGGEINSRSLGSGFTL